MEQVEVFKTNVETGEQATRLVQLIQQHFPGSAVNFDLDDCDRILRFQTNTGIIPTDQLFQLVRSAGFQAEVLADEIPPFAGVNMLISATKD